MKASKLTHQIQNSSLNTWLTEIVPLIMVIASLWCKKLYFFYSLKHVWWGFNEPFKKWLMTHPEIFSANLVILLLIVSLVIFLPRINRFVVLIILDFLLTSLIVADRLHVLWFAEITSISEMPSAAMLPKVSESIIKLLKPSYLVYYFDIFLGILVLPFYINACKHIQPFDRKHIKRIFAGSLVASILFAAPTLRLFWNDKHALFASTTLQRDACGTIGLLPYHVIDIVSHLGGRNDKIGELNLKRVKHFLAKEHKEKNSKSNLFGIAQGRNVIMIMVESLSSFPIGLQVNGQPITPNLSAFAKESLYFVNFYDQAHLGSTSDGEFISLQSLYPVALGTISMNYNSRSFFGLPAILSQHGYTTLSATAEAAWFWNMKRMHNKLGFQQSYFQDKYNIRERIGTWLSDDEFFKQTIPILNTLGEPFLAYLLTSSTHHPYEVPKKYHELNLGEMEGTMIGNYLHSVHYFDTVFGEFVDRLREFGLLDRSIVVVYGDHKCKQIELYYIKQLLGYPESREYYTWMLKQKLPLIIRLPNGEAADLRQVSGGHLDIAPTVLSLLGVIDEKNVMLGSDLTKGENSLVVFRNGSFTDGKYIFINRLGPVSQSTCYEASTGLMTDCKPLEEKRLKALERLEISDLIIHGDLIPALRSDGNNTPTH